MSYTESTWKTSYDLKRPRFYPSDNELIFDDESFMNNNNHHQSPPPDSQTLQITQRKISKQKPAAEHRSENMNGNHIFDSPYSASRGFDSSLRHSAGSRLLHSHDDVILTNDFTHQAFHQPNTRKITKITPKENHSISNSRPVQPRSASASSGLATRHKTKDPLLTPSDIQRLKNVRRHEPAQVSSGPAAKKSLITPDSWKNYPVVLKKSAPIKKPAPETVVNKSAKRDEISKPTIEEPSIPKKPHTEKPKRERSVSKPAVAETPKPVKQEKTKEEKAKIQKYIEEKRHEHEKSLSTEKQSKRLQEKERKDKLKKLNEQIKKVAQQPLPASLIKKSASSHLPPQDHSEQTRERILHLLGPKIIIEPPTEQHRNTPFEKPPPTERSRSPSSSSSSSESIVEIQPPKIEQTPIHSRTELPTSGVEQRHQNILRWAMNLTRDCDNIENKFKYLRPDGTQPFDLIASTHPHLQQEDGNLRSQKPVVFTNKNKIESKPIVPSKILRPSGRLISTNQNLPSEYQGQQLPGVGDLRDPALERRVKRDRAAAKIQAAYRGYTVRKSMHWIDEKQQLNSEYNKRPLNKPKKTSSHPMDIFDTPALNIDMRMSDDNFTIGSTLLRHYERNGVKLAPSTSAQSQPPKIERPASLQTYSDDYENVTSTRSLTPVKQKQVPEKPRIVKQPIPEKSRPVQQPMSEKPRIIQQTALSTESTSSRTSSSSTSSSITPTATPEPRQPLTTQRRRSISPPLPPQMSSDNGRPIYHHPPPSHKTTHRKSDERRYSPDALERQLNAELHLLDGVEASMQQVDNMERLRSVALAQQEIVSLAQVLKNKPASEPVPQQQVNKSSARQVSSSSSSSSPPLRKHHSPSRRRTTQSNSSSSSESILTARARQKFYNETELKAYEKRLKDVEQKIRVLVKRDENIDDHQIQTKVNASEIFDEKRPTGSPRAQQKYNSDSSISENIPVSHKSSSSTTSTAIQRKPTNDISEIRTETIQSSYQQPSVDSVTTDGSDIERRIRTYEEQLKAKKTELDKLKQRKNKESLRRQEDELRKKLETYNQQIETLRTQPVSPKVVTPSRKPAPKDSSSSSSSGTSTPTKPQESSIAEELPPSSTTTPSQPKNDLVQKKVPVVKKERNFFDDDEEEEEKPAKLKPLETPRDERDTQHDAQSLSIATDIAASSSETDNDDSRRPSIDNGKPILNLNQKLPSPLKSKEDSESSTSTTTSERPSKKQSIERKASPIANDYDEDFSDVSHSHTPPNKEPAQPPKPKVDELDIESIQEDLEEKQSVHDTNQSVSSKSSGDEQSEILVLVKKSANTTPRRQDDKTLEDELPVPPPVSLPEPKVDTNNNTANDDTSHDVSEDEEVNEQENKVDKLTDLFLRTFIDEAIDQGKEIDRLKKANNQKSPTPVTKAKRWLSDEDFPDEDYSNQINTGSNEFAIDLSGLADEPRVESPRKPVIEEPVKPLVPHTREQVTQLCDQAIQILFGQNTDFSDRSTIRCRIPDSYFTNNLQDPENENIRRNHHAYCQMIFNLSVELLHEMYSENIEEVKYPEWQKTKLVPKRFYRGKRPTNRHEIEQIIQKKILEILNLDSRQITYSKWRVSNNQRPGAEKFETVLDEEIRRGESDWVNYDNDCIQMKFDVADLIFDQLIQETLTECFHIMEERLNLSSNSTRL